MIKELISFIFKPKDANDALLFGSNYYDWWCEQRGVVELPIAPEHIKDPFLEEREISKEDMN